MEEQVDAVVVDPGISGKITASAMEEFKTKIYNRINNF